MQRVLHAKIETRAQSTGAKKTWPIVVSTETPVLRDGYKEILRHTPEAIDLSRAPLPVIEVHDRSRLNIGVVENLRIDQGKLRGELRLGSSARAQELAADIDDEIITGVSIGYSIIEHDTDDDARTVTATRWMPFETSLAPVPADIAAGINRGLPNMTDTATPAPAPAAAVPAAQPGPGDQTTPVAERRRAAEILKIANRAGLESTLAADWIEQGISIEAARARAFDVLADRDMHHHPGALVTEDVRHTEFRAAAVDGLLLRYGIQVAKPHAAARDVARMSLKEVMRTTLRLSGERVDGLNDSQLVRAAMTTSDFHGLLENVANKSMSEGMLSEYPAATHRRWMKLSTAVDFKDHMRVLMGSAPSLVQINEGGEYPHSVATEMSRRFRVKKYGRILKLTFETLMNDDLSGFTAIPRAFGLSALREEANVTYWQLAENDFLGPMDDAWGIPLFHADNANTFPADPQAEPADLLTAVKAGRLMLRLRHGTGGALASGSGALNLSPKYLLVHPRLETDAELMLARASKSSSHGVDHGVAPGFANLELVVDPRVPPDYAYLIADNNVIDTAELAILEGHPVIQSREGFVIDDQEWKCRHVFASAFLDHRSIIRLRVSGYNDELPGEVVGVGSGG